MKSKTMNILISGAVLMSLAACAPTKNRASSTADVQKTQIKADKTNMDASGLADAGEQLVSPYTFMLADKVFDMALEKDPSNIKAQFYKTLIKRAMVFKGIMTRVRPYAKKYGNIQQLEATTKNIPYSPLRDFLLDGKEDLQTPGDIQNVVVSYANAVNDFRKFLKNNSDMSLTLNLNPYIFNEQIQNNAMKNCVVNDSSPDNVDVECDYREAAITKISSADVAVLAQMEAGEVLYYAAYTSYSLQGSEKLISHVDDADQMTPQQAVALISSIPTLGKIRADQTMSLIQGLGADFSVAQKWAVKYQSKLCPKGPDVDDQRRGYLFNSGICVDNSSDAQQQMAMLDQALKGAINIDMPDVNGNTVSTKVDYLIASRSPVKDLKTLLPNKFNSCGKAIGLADKTLGGVFPNQDAERFVLSDTVCE